MPTNLKTLLSRSRSKNELKLRESKDENSPSGSESSCYKCESGPYVPVSDTLSRRESSGESSLYSSSSNGRPYLRNDNESENNYFHVSSSDLSYDRNKCSGNEKAAAAGSYYLTENFHRDLGSESASSGASMLPSGNRFHNGCLTSQSIQQRGVGAYQCCSGYNPHYTSYDAGNGRESCGYFVDEKSNVTCPSSRPNCMMMDQRDTGGDMRRNASCKTLFFSCNTIHQPTCNTFEPPCMDTTSDFSLPSYENHGSLVTSNGNVAAVPSTMPTLSQGRKRVTDDGSSLACESPSAPRCTFNVKDGSPCQSLSMRKCETVLALSNFNGNVSTTTTTPVTTSTNPYARNSTSVGGGTYSNFPSTVTAGSTVSHLSSSSITSSNVGGKVRVMKEKIFSTSSSALNCLLHSSSRTGKLFSGWKLNSTSNSSNSGSNSNIGHISNMYGGSSEGNNCLGVNYQPNKHFLGTSSISSTSASTSDNNKHGSTAHIGHPHKSRSQLSIAENGFSSPAPLTPVNRLRRNVSVNNTSTFCAASASLSAHSSYSRSSSVASFGWKEREEPFDQGLLCRLCLCQVRLEDTMEILACSCRYCKDCLISYVSFEIQQGADEIACPDAGCEKQGVLGLLEVEHLVSPMLLEKHKKFRLFREVEKDSKLMWCPSPGCETVCQIQDGSSILTGSFVPEGDRTRATATGGSRILPLINCPTCRKTYCAECKLSWHPDSSCESFRRKLIKQGKLSSEDDELFSLDSIKKCPFCHVPIEKDSGCAQMMCKRCKHVFCWYCLASLDDDFLLRHYDKGPCKNKLGHSRASVVWHRAQVIGIFAGFGVLVLLASPLLILAAPCLLCCRCRYCANKLDPDESPVPV